MTRFIGIGIGGKIRDLFNSLKNCTFADELSKKEASK
jgi:hypothetical protein